MTFCFRKTSFVHSRSGTYYALLLGYFGPKYLPDIRHCVYWVLAEIWAQIHPRGFAINFLFITARAERMVCLCVKLFDFFPRWILIRLTWNLSDFVTNSVEILTCNFWKKLFRENIFQKFYRKPRLSSTETCEISPYFLQFYHGFVLRWKKITQVLSYVFCIQVRRHIHKQITKRRHVEENPWRFVFEKLVLFTLGLWLTTPYSLGIFVWNIYPTFIILSIEFLLRFEPQICPTRFAINFLFITARAEIKVCLCVKLCYFFPRWILICLTWNLLHFVPNSVEILTWNFKRKLFHENFSEILSKTKSIIYRNLSNFVILFAILSCVGIALKKFTQVLSYVVCTQRRRHVHKQITKRGYGKEKSGRFFFSKNQFCSLSVWDLRRLTPWKFWYEIFSRHSSLCLWSFGWDLSPKFVPKDLQ